MFKQNKKIIKRRASRFGKKPLVLAGVAVAVAGAIVWTAQNDTSSPIGPDGAPSTAISSTATKKPSTSNSVPQGGATDKNGQAPAPTTSSSQWTTSASGVITVQQPTQGSTLKSGSYLAGTAKVGQVYYRLVDNSVGKISEGALNVVGGKFSGILQFQPHASGGQLDVFSYNTNGAEVNEVQINIGF